MLVESSLSLDAVVKIQYLVDIMQNYSLIGSLVS